MVLAVRRLRGLVVRLKPALEPRAPRTASGRPLGRSARVGSLAPNRWGFFCPNGLVPTPRGRGGLAWRRNGATETAAEAFELDDFFDAELIQYREIMGHKSQEFLKLFPNVSYEKGDIVSEARLLVMEAVSKARAFLCRHDAHHLFTNMLYPALSCKQTALQDLHAGS